MTESYASPVCRPIMNEWGNREVCLCIHGFCGSPGFYLPLTDLIRAAGYDQCAPLLAGHGTKYQDMLAVKCEDWLADIRRTMDELLEKYDKVHITGMSLGGALAAYAAGLYAHTGKVGKVQLMVPGFALRNKDFYKKDYAAFTDEKIPLVLSSETPAEFRESSYLYEFMYWKSVGELLRIGPMCEAQLTNITAPVWVLYTNADPVVDPACCAAAAAKCRNLVECHAYEKTGHNLLIDCEYRDVFARTEAWLHDPRG